MRERIFEFLALPAYFWLWLAAKVCGGEVRIHAVEVEDGEDCD